MTAAAAGRRHVGAVFYTAKTMALDFEPFTVHDDVSVSFSIKTGQGSSDVTFDNDFVNQTLGKTNGKVEHPTRWRRFSPRPSDDQTQS